MTSVEMAAELDFAACIGRCHDLCTGCANRIRLACSERRARLAMIDEKRACRATTQATGVRIDHFIAGSTQNRSRLFDDPLAVLEMTWILDRNPLSVDG